MVRALIGLAALLLALWAVLYGANAPSRRLRAAWAWRLARALGLASLVAFTSVTVAMAVVAGEAVVFYHGPNPVIWLLEVALGAHGVAVGVHELVSCFAEALLARIVK